MVIIYLGSFIAERLKRHSRLIGGYGLAPDKCLPQWYVAIPRRELLPRDFTLTHSFRPKALEQAVYFLLRYLFPLPFF
jgi:hypothetical protein